MRRADMSNVPPSCPEDCANHQLFGSKVCTLDQNGQTTIMVGTVTLGNHQAALKRREKGASRQKHPAAQLATTAEENQNNLSFPSFNQNWGGSVHRVNTVLVSQTNQNYAGPKFSKPPSPSLLPSRWVALPLAP